MGLEEVGVLLVRRDGTGLVSLPQIRGEVLECVGDSVEHSVHKVTLSGSLTTRRGITVLNTSKFQNLLGDSTGNKSRTERGGDQSEANGTALTGDLARHGVRFSKGGAPVTETNRDKSELCGTDGTANRGGDLTRALNAETDMTSFITDKDVSLEARALTGAGHLLDRADLDDLILELAVGELINDFRLLDGEGKEVHFIETLDVAMRNQTTELGDRGPSTAFASATASTTASATAVTATATTAVSSATSTTVSTPFLSCGSTYTSDVALL